MSKYSFEGYGKENNSNNSRGIYDSEGYDGRGFNKHGIHRNGTRYDNKGYDVNGYNKYGFDVLGYDKEGNMFDGFDTPSMAGSTVKSNEEYLYGYDREGYDRNGYDLYGYNREGYDKNGYNRKGFNVVGRYRDGSFYDKDGYDKDGYDKDGYNREGHDRNGYDLYGYNKDSYDKDGYNRIGYNAEGYDRNGYNQEGYDRNGFDVLGFNKEGYDYEGFNITGRNREMFDLFGFDEYGFNKEGIGLGGEKRENYDFDGYSISTGYNLLGFNREGFNANGIDKDGYNRQGYHYITGFDREGYDEFGYDKYGYNKSGFNRKGYDKRGFDILGYDCEGYTKDGYDKDGYDKEGYDREGYNFEGINRDGKLRPKNKNMLTRGVVVYHTRFGKGEISHIQPDAKHMEIYFEESQGYRVINIDNEFNNTLFLEIPDYIAENNRKYDDNQVINEVEQKHFARFSDFVKNHMKNEVESYYLPDNIPCRYYLDEDGCVIEREDYFFVDSMVQNMVRHYLDSAYFCHVLYGKGDIYIGKNGLEGWVVDWADEKAAIYYQYQMYIGLPEYGLELVRDIDIRFAKYLGYIDLYNKHALGETTTADKRLQQILLTNRSNKRIHDIIESIQMNQYEIITADKSQNMIVLGCAGSGKTMIMLHKIRYMKYNNPDLQMKNVIVISPTDVLERESKELSKILQIDMISQHSVSSFYKDALQTFVNRMNLPGCEITVVESVVNNVDAYETENLLSLYEKVKILIDPTTDMGYRFLVTEEKEKLENLIERIQNVFMNAEVFQNMYRYYSSAKKRLETTYLQDIEKYLVLIQKEMDNDEQNKRDLELLTFLLERQCFGDGDGESHSSERPLFIISELSKCVDWRNLKYYLEKTGKEITGATRVVQLMALFSSEDRSEESLKNVIKSLRKYSQDEMVEYLDVLRKRISGRDVLLKQRKAILLSLVEKKFFKKKENAHALSDEAIKEKGKIITQFFLYSQVVSLPYDEVMHYLDEYARLEARLRRVNKQIKNGGTTYLFDTILSVINLEEKEHILFTNAQMVQLLFVLCKFCGAIDSGRKYIFVDEFQDCSKSEICLMQDLYPNAILNLFGDINQCISTKGISTREVLKEFTGYNIREISENYRNAKQIAEYVRDEFEIDMMPIGLQGSVKKSDRVTLLDFKADDRIAVIVGNESTEELDCLPADKVNYYVRTGEIKRNMYNVLPVSVVKGLEFEKVEVLTKSMSRNERYVACTRAIDELVVVE